MYLIIFIYYKSKPRHCRLAQPSLKVSRSECTQPEGPEGEDFYVDLVADPLAQSLVAQPTIECLRGGDSRRIVAAQLLIVRRKNGIFGLVQVETLI